MKWTDHASRRDVLWCNGPEHYKEPLCVNCLGTQNQPLPWSELFEVRDEKSVR